jgi:stage V sporulation protein G
LGEADKMEITEVRVRLVNNKDDRLKAFCAITLDREFIVRDIKVLEGMKGNFVGMPSRKMSDHCEKCGGKNHLKAKYCNNCGAALAENRGKKNPRGKIKLHADIAHPINMRCRKIIWDRVIHAFNTEVEKSKQPDYKPVTINGTDDDIPEAM